MVYTLRITGFFAFVLAVGLSAFGFVYGIESNPQVAETLAQPSVLEMFKAESGPRKSSPSAQVHPLVVEALSFHNYLDPPPPPVSEGPKTPPRTDKPITPRPPKVTGKFQVMGTSYNAVDPNLSLALIDEAGSGMRWVRVDDQVGHQRVKAIKDQALVMDNDEELTITEASSISLVVRPGEEGRSTLLDANIVTKAVSQQPPTSQRPWQPPAPSSRGTIPLHPGGKNFTPTDEDQETLKRITEQFREIGQNGVKLSEEDEKARHQLMEKLAQRMRAKRISSRNEQQPTPRGEEDDRSRRVDPNRGIHVEEAVAD